MRTAPPADYPVASPGPWHHLGVTLAMLGAGVLAAWAASHLQLSIPLLALCGACATGLMVHAGRRGHAAPRQRLRWDGQDWRLITPGAQDAAGAVGNVRVVIDLGDGLLLRWAATGPRRAQLLPLWRERDQVPAWQALRVAVQASRGYA
jgi:hypothetical protein